jgi:hypothetical protein
MFRIALGGNLDAHRVVTPVQSQHSSYDDSACDRQRVAVRTHTAPPPARVRDWQRSLLRSVRYLPWAPYRPRPHQNCALITSSI